MATVSAKLLLSSFTQFHTFEMFLHRCQVIPFAFEVGPTQSRDATFLASVSDSAKKKLLHLSKAKLMLQHCCCILQHQRKAIWWPLQAAKIRFISRLYPNYIKLLGFETFHFLDGIRFGLNKKIIWTKNWYRKIWYLKSLGFGIKKYRIWYGGKFWIRFHSDFGFRHTLVHPQKSDCVKKIRKAPRIR